MKRSLEVCLIALSLAGGVPSAAAQSEPATPMQRGIAVTLPATSHAVAVPDADKEDALVVTVTQDGSVYIGLDPTSTAALSDGIRDALSARREKTLYIKADAHVQYSRIVRVLDSVRAAGVQRFTLLTAQGDSEKPGTLVPPKGLEMLIAPRL